MSEGIKLTIIHHRGTLALADLNGNPVASQTDISVDIPMNGNATATVTVRLYDQDGNLMIGQYQPEAMGGT